MLRLLLGLTPANLLHEFGTGRALENADRERVEIARTMAVVDALARRLEPPTRVTPANAGARAAA